MILFGAALCLLNAIQVIEGMKVDDTSEYVSVEGMNSLKGKADHMSIVTAEQDEKPYTLEHETFKVVSVNKEYIVAVNMNRNEDKERLYFQHHDITGNDKGMGKGDIVTAVFLDDSEEEDLFLFVYKEDTKGLIYD